MKTSCLRACFALLTVILVGAGLPAHAAPVSLNLTSPATITSLTNVNLNSNITVTGGTSPYSFSLAAASAALPANVFLSSSGSLTGNPGVASDTSILVHVTDSGAQSADLPIELKINAFGLTSFSKVPAAVGVPFVYTPQTNNGGTAPYTYSLVAGSVLPPGLSFNSAIGKIVGAPTSAASGPYTNITVQVIDSSSPALTATLPLEIDVGALVYTGSNNVIFISGAPSFSYQLTTAGGTPPYTYTQTGGTLPTGLSLSPGGVLGGATTAATTTVPITVSINDSATPQNTTAVVINVAPQAFGIPSPQVATATVGTPFSYTSIAPFGNGTAPFKMSGFGNVPGLSFTAATGVLSGTPTAGGNYTFFINPQDATNMYGATASVVVSIPVTTLTLTATPANLTIAPGVNVSTGGTAAGGVSPYVYTLSGTLPAGLTFNPNSPNFQITGSPTTAAISTTPYNLTLTATDSVGTTAPLAIQIVVSKMAITSPLTATAEAGVFFSYSASSTGGSFPVTYTATGLPAGLTINSNGAIRGKVATAGTYPIVITATDSAAATATATLQLSVLPVAVTSPSSFQAIVGQAYSYQLTAAGGTGPYSFALATGITLPAGLSLSSGGLITGTATTSGPGTPFSVTVTDSTAGTPLTTTTALGNFSVAAFGVPSPIAVTAQLGTSFTFTLPVGGGKSPYFFSGASLPAAGLQFSSAGVISGTPTQAGTFTPFFQVSDSSTPSNFGGTGSFTITVPAPPLMASPSSLATNLITNSFYNNNITVTGGFPAYSYVATGLPPGLTVNGNGTISGAATTAGSYPNGQVVVTDNVGTSVTVLLPLTVRSYGISTTSNSVAAVGVPFSQSYLTTGLTAPLTWSATGLPAGLTIGTTNGVVNGTPTALGSSTATITVSDSSASAKTVGNPFLYTVQTVLATSNPTLIDITGAAYNDQLTAVGGTGTYTFALSGSTPLPSGLNFNPSGLISGASTAAASTFVTPYSYTVTDSAGHTATGNFNFSTHAVGIPAPVTAPVATANVPYSFTLHAAGGSGTYTYTSSGLPAGLSLNPATGVISGTPTIGSTGFFINVNATDSTGAAGTTVNFPLVITPAQLVITSPNTASGLTNFGFNYQVTTTGGSGSLVYSISGALPAGLSLSSFGTLSGTPTVAGTFTPTITVTDGAGATASLPLTLTTAVFGITTSPTPAAAAVGVPYSLTNFTQGGVGAVTYTAAGLPAGLAISAGGVISGTPTAVGVTPVTVSAHDSSAVPQTASTVITITVRTVAATFGGPIVAVIGVPYSYQLTAAGGTPPYTFAITSGTLPPGLSLSASGLLSGTASATSNTSANIGVLITDHAGNTAPAGFFVRENLFGVNSPQVATGAAGSPFSFQPALGGGTPPYTIGASALPFGLSINPATGLISGTTSFGGTFNLNLTSTDSSAPVLTGTNAPLAIYFTPLPLTASYSGPTSQLVNFAYPSSPISVSGGIAPYTFAVTSGALPAGLTLSSSGSVFGTPTTATPTGPAQATITITDQAGTTATVPVSITVTSFGFSFGPSLNVAYAKGIPIAYNDAAVGGTGTVTYSSTPLPAGLTYNSSTGLFSGTPTALGTTSVTLTATDSTSKTATTVLNINVVPMVVNTGTAAFGIVSLSFNEQIGVVGGTGPYTFSIPGGTVLPAGMSFSAQGVFSGTPTATKATATVPVTITDSTAGTPNTVTINFSVGAFSFGTPNPQQLNAPAGFTGGYTIPVAGGTPPYNFSTSFVPPGLTFNNSTGALSGTTTVGNFYLPITVGDSSGRVFNSQIQLVVSPVPVSIATPPAAATVIAGQNASFSVVATGTGPLTYQWYKNGIALTVPSATSANLSLSAVPIGTSGMITVTVSSPYSSATSTGVALTVNPIAPVLPSSGSSTAIVGNGFTYNPPLNGATSVTYTVSPTLPAGLSLNTQTGAITGTAAGTAAPASFTLTATNTSGSASETLSLTVVAPAPSITSAAATTGAVNVAFTFNVTATNAPTSYSASGLPTWAAIDPVTGSITGTPNVAGTTTATVTATNGTGAVSQPLTITIAAPPNAPSYTGSPNASGVQGTSFTFQPVFANSVTGYALTGTGLLPTGLSLNPNTGLISGTTTVTGAFPVMIAATGTGGTTAAPVTITINASPNAPSISSAATTSGTAGTAFTFQLTATNSPTGFSATNLPAWASFNSSTGVISGSAPTAGTFDTIQVSAANGSGSGPVAGLLIQINPALAAPVVTSQANYTVTVGVAENDPLTASNSPISYAITSGTLPAGLSLSSGGVITGTPTSVATGGVVGIAATNASGAGLSLLINFVVVQSPNAPVIYSSASAQGQVGQAFNYQIANTNAATSYAVAGTLPAGLSLNSATGVISGVPSTATTTPAVVGLSAISTGVGTGSQNLSITILPAPATPVINSAASTAGQVGTAFSYQISATNSPTSYSATSLPAGLVFNPTTGLISGTPTVAGPFTATLSAGNAGGLGATSALSLVIAAAPAAPAITSGPTATAAAGAAFSYQTVAAPGTILSYALTGTLPNGLAFNTSTGLISGKGVESGTSTVTLTATSSAGTSLPQSVAITITPNAGAPVMTNTASTGGMVGVALTPFQLAATNLPTATPFVPPVMLEAVNLPPGLAVNPATGLITGTPTQAGVFLVSVIGVNSTGQGPTGTLTFTIAPAANAPVITSSAAAPAQAGQPFSYQITTNSTIATTYDATGAPPWLSVDNSSGALSGTPPGPGPVTVNLVATNVAGTGPGVPLTIKVAPAANTPVIAGMTPVNATVGTSFTFTPSASLNPTSYGAVGLPPGLSINQSTGVISGTPTSSGTFSISIYGTNAAGQGASGPLVLTVAASATLP